MKIKGRRKCSSPFELIQNSKSNANAKESPEKREGKSRLSQVGCAPLGAPSGAAQAHWVPSGPEKISKKLRGVWTPFDIGFLRCKKQEKNNNWHWALGQ